MKVFISWSGEHSRKLAEVLRDWLPGVLQLVTPYFTPSDIEKGARWSSDITKQLSECQIGILCVTRENIHSDWILFEAGALSKSLEKSHVCPIIFGISNTDLAGPLKQFQTTEFEKDDFHRLLGVINGRLGDQKLPQKTLDTVFEKWWPDLDNSINEILAEKDDSDEPIRSDRELLEEILTLNRMASLEGRRPKVAPKALEDLLERFIKLHDHQAGNNDSYQAVLDQLQEMEKALLHISRRHSGDSEKVNELMAKINDLSYKTEPKESAVDDNEPF